MTVDVHVKRVYEPATDDDGYRVLVDRLWPRGVAKDAFHYDEWCKDLAPTSKLRAWFGHKPENWDRFQKDYQAELREPEQLGRMREVIAAAEGKRITLLYGAKDVVHNQALVLAKEMKRVSKG